MPSFEESSVPPSGARPERWRRIAEMTCSFAYTLHVTPAGAVMIDWLSNGLTDVLGWSLSELETTSAADAALLLPEEAPLISAWLGRIINGERITLEHRLRTKDGGVRWVRNHACSVRDEAGRAILIDGAVLDITERVLAEESRRRTAATLKAIVDNAPLAIIACDLQGTLTAWNASAERLFGFTDTEALGRPTPIVREEDWHAFERTLELARQGDIPRPTAGLRRRRDGRDVLVSGSRAVLRDAAGTPIGIVAMLADISEQARAAVALSESEERYRSVVTDLEEGITLHDEDGRILTANRSAARILGMPASDLVGRSLLDASWGTVDEDLHPFPAERHPLAIALDSGAPSSGVLLRVDTPEDEHRWIQLSARTIPRPMPTPECEGSGARVVCVFSDVTAARNEEELRRRSEQNFRTLIERSPDAVAVYQGATVLYANPRMLALLGYESSAELVGRSPIDFVHPEDRAMVLDRIVRYSQRGLETPAAEERFLRRDGTAVSVDVSAIPIFFDEAPSTLVHARDLTVRKRLEAQLVMADRLASVGRLAATVGHEINNPLAYVLTNLEIALERLGDGGAVDAARAAEIGEMLREAREGADRVRHIVRDLKVFSRGESEERTAVDPRRVIDSCANMAKGEIRHRARLVKRYGNTPRVVANEARLGQVLLNLLINAAHAIPEDAQGENEITVTTSTDERDRVVIEVRDTGTGIPEDVRRHIFEPFFTTKTGGAGTGLGLSICQSIVVALGGEITVESEVGKGTAFRVYLPAAHGSEPPQSRIP
ncbi:Sensory box histidine kinase/response regulator [Minicystis rosea]|nr:Sensory box histidine kinase/response regulator [Minicystis rosea]